MGNPECATRRAISIPSDGSNYVTPSALSVYSPTLAPAYTARTPSSAGSSTGCTSTASRPARTPGSFSASATADSSVPAAISSTPANSLSSSTGPATRVSASLRLLAKIRQMPRQQLRRLRPLDFVPPRPPPQQAPENTASNSSAHRACRSLSDSALLSSHLANLHHAIQRR